MSASLRSPRRDAGMTKNVDIKQLSDGTWLICDPFTGHVYFTLPASTSEDEVLDRAADAENGWLPKDRGF